MKDTKHTPGPWICTGGRSVVDNLLISEQQDTTFSLAVIPNKYRPKALNEANAKLIAAAPELLEALQELINEWEKIRVETHGNYVFDNIWKRGQAAIKKATE